MVQAWPSAARWWRCSRITRTPMAASPCRRRCGPTWGVRSGSPATDLDQRDPEVLAAGLAMTGSVGDRNMKQARMILLALAAAAAGLAGCSPAPDASNAPPASYEAQPAHDAHESQDPHESH